MSDMSQRGGSHATSGDLAASTLATGGHAIEGGSGYQRREPLDERGLRPTRQRLSDAFGLTWDRRIDGPLPLAQHTLSAPDPDKWKKNAAEVEAVLPGLQPVIARAQKFLSASGIAL